MKPSFSTIRDWPETERPREKMLHHGAEMLTDVELVAILLRTGGIESTAIDLARELMQRFTSFRALDQKTIEDLCQVKDIGPAKAVQIKAAIEIGKRFAASPAAKGDVIESSEDIYRIMRLYLQNLDREEFHIVLLTNRNKVLLKQRLFQGSLSSSLVEPREIIKTALNYSAASVIFVHNHPSGNPSPSAEDKSLTKRLKMACEVMGIRVLDHIIIGSETYFSFNEHSLL